MFVVHSYSLAVGLCVIIMLCWGSWANTRKLARKDWRFELFYWSEMRGRWRTFGDFGQLRLTLERANEVFRAESIFHSHASR